ncbi:MAG: hypothetical protein H6R26_1308 [Proteobacteria bacterium]|nr:hypothetical protein [Pseudomonadota bacterium]
MRDRVSIAMILSLAAFTATGEESNLAPQSVPQPVIAAFQKAYPSAQEVKFEKEEGGAAALFEVEFNLAGKAMEAVYDAQGKLVYTEEEVATGDLPSTVAAAISKDYPKAKLQEAEKLLNPDGSLRGWEVEIEEGEKELEVELDAAGKIVGVKAD